MNNNEYLIIGKTKKRDLFIERQEKYAWMAERCIKTNHVLESVFPMIDESLFATKTIFFGFNETLYGLLKPKKYFILCAGYGSTLAGVPSIDIIGGCEMKNEVGYMLSVRHAELDFDYKVDDDPLAKLLDVELSETNYRVFAIVKGKTGNNEEKYYIIKECQEVDNI